MSWRLARGHSAEQHARRYLEDRGLRTRASNYRCRWGEIDLVMDHDDTVVFVEVRYRRSRDYGGAVASVDRRKQQRVIRAAAHYLARHGLTGHAARFDVVAMVADEPCEWIAGAFDAGA